MGTAVGKRPGVDDCTALTLEENKKSKLSGHPPSCKYVIKFILYMMKVNMTMTMKLCFCFRQNQSWHSEFSKICLLLTEVLIYQPFIII